MPSKKPILITILISLFLINLVSAQFLGNFGFDIRRGSNDVINLVVNWAAPFLNAILGGDDYSGYLLFEKFLIFLLLLGIIYIALKQVDIFEDNEALHWMISIIVPILSLRFMNFQWIHTILLQYQVLGVALGGLLPFIIYLFFLHGVAESSVVRKIGWIFFIVVYYGLWTTSADPSIDFSGSGAYGEVYFWTMAIAFIFLLFDGTIHRVMEGQKWAHAQSSGFVEAIARIDDQINKLQRASGIPTNVRDREIRKLTRRRKKLRKQIT